MNQNDSQNGGNGQNGPAGFAGDPPKPDALYEVTHVENTAGRVVFVREPVVYEEDAGKPPTEFVGEATISIPRPNGPNGKMVVRFPIPAQNVIEAYERFDQCVQMVAQGAAEEARRQQKAGKILAADGKPVIRRGPRR